MSLHVHLQDQQQVYFDEDDDLNDFVIHVAPETNLTAFHKLNTNNQIGNNINLKYIDIPSMYTWNQQQKE